VAVPISRGAQLQGFLLTGFSLSDATALEVKRMSGTEVVYLARGGEGGGAGGAPQVVAGTLAPELEERLLAALPVDGAAGEDGDAAGGRRLDLVLGGERWSALVSPLLDAAGQAVGTSVALAPLEPQLAPFRRITRALLLAGAGALLLALGLTFAFARRTMEPVRALVAATAAARAGDYEHPIPLDRDDELGQLAAAFDDLLTDLREKRDMETYLAELSRTLPDPAPAVRVVPAGAVRGEVTLMLVEMRSHAAARRGEEPRAALDRFSADLSHLARAAAVRRGELLALAGHRAWLAFEGDGRTFRAFATAAELVRRYVDEGRLEAAPVVALASGEAVSGAVAWGEERRPARIGRPVQRLEGLAREASPGDLALSAEAAEELRSTFEAAGYPLVEQRSVLGGPPLYVVGARTVAAMIGDQALPTLSAGDITQGAAAAPATLSGIAPGSVVGGRFEILSVLGAGGMGVVYKARDRELDEVVAVKMLKTELAGDVASAGRLRDELRLARRITHPNVLRTFDLGEVSGIPFISMEYVRGVTLAQLLEHTGRMAYSAGLSVAKQLCQGLAAAHAVGVLHRDIKPANLILQANGNAKLMDFGIARPIRRAEPGQTVDGWLVGTPKYLAPEQLRGEEPDARADIYAAGVLFYEMFTGESPFTGASYMELATKTLKEVPKPPSDAWPEVPAELEAILLRCLEKDPAQRYPNAEALLADLSRLRG
jgi:serine/threonine-protein kinase